METSAQQILEYLESLEGASGTRLQDVIDDEVFEVLAGVAWVRQALLDFARLPVLETAPESPGGRKSLAA